MPATIEVDVAGRWDAVALMQRLNPYHSYLIQLAPEHWLVRAEAPGCDGAPLPGALAAIEESLADRHIQGSELRVNGRPYRRRRPGDDAVTRAREVRTVRRYTHLFLFTAFIAVAMLALRAPSARPSTSVHARATATQVTVTMTEFRFVLSVRTVHVGAITFRLVNRGHLGHDFKIAGKKSALIQPGKRGLLRVVFRRAGRFPYVCTVSGHAAAGMKGVLKVTQ